MKSLSLFAAMAAVGAWLLWELRPAHYHHFVETSYDQPYLIFAFESLVALAAAAILLLAVVALQSGLRETLVPWSANRFVRVQLLVTSSAAITGIYGVRQIVQMNGMLRGDWGTGQTFWVGPSSIAVLALSPWIVFIAAAVVSSVAAKLTGAISVAILLFDILSTAYLAFIFVHLGYWACLSCSGPAM
jgi:hypothetical protein